MRTAQTAAGGASMSISRRSSRIDGMESRSEAPSSPAGKPGRLHAYRGTARPAQRTVVKAPRAGLEVVMGKRSEKPKKLQKKHSQKTLKEGRSEKRAAKRFGSG